MPAAARAEREPEPGGRRGRSGRGAAAAAEGGRRLPAPRPAPAPAAAGVRLAPPRRRLGRAEMLISPTNSAKQTSLHITSRRMGCELQNKELRALWHFSPKCDENAGLVLLPTQDKFPRLSVVLDGLGGWRPRGLHDVAVDRVPRPGCGVTGPRSQDPPPSWAFSSSFSL